MSNQITILFYILFLQLKNDDLTTDFLHFFLLILEHFFRSSVCAECQKFKTEWKRHFC